MDRVRQQQVPNVGPTLDYLDEAFTSENWIVRAISPSRVPLETLKLTRLQVRIYEVKKEDLLGRDLKSANAFTHGKKRKRSKPVSRRRAIV